MSDQPLPSSSLSPSIAPAAAVPAAEANALEERKQTKVRSAWISFVGRIVAQVIGAVTTVVLGFAIVSSHVSKLPGMSAAANTGTDSAVSASQQEASKTPRPAARTRRAQGTALAVLPFEDFSPTRSQVSIADGLTEAVTAALARGGMQVTSRTSAMQYKKPTRVLPEIAAELGVDYVIEGSIQRQADRVRVTIQLIDAATDTHVWAETYDRQARDLLALGAALGADIDRDLRNVLSRTVQAAPPVGSATADAPIADPSVRTAF